MFALFDIGMAGFHWRWMVGQAYSLEFSNCARTAMMCYCVSVDWLSESAILKSLEERSRSCSLVSRFVRCLVVVLLG
jgi:hypothetical protein